MMSVSQPVNWLSNMVHLCLPKPRQVPYCLLSVLGVERNWVANTTYPHKAVYNTKNCAAGQGHGRAAQMPPASTSGRSAQGEYSRTDSNGSMKDSTAASRDRRPFGAAAGMLLPAVQCQTMYTPVQCQTMYTPASFRQHKEVA